MEELAQVYARSLFQVAREQDKLDLLREQLGQVADAIAKHRELQTFFFSPYFSTEEKQDALERVLDGADPLFVNFLNLLIEKHRMPVIFRVRSQYERLWEEENRTLPVEITSAVELDSATTEAEHIRARVAAKKFNGRKMTLSIGVATFPEDADDAEAIIAVADEALYQAKREGRDRTVRAHRLKKTG